MDCKKIKDLVMAGYLDGELNESLRKEVEEHLAACAGCRQFKENLAEIAVEPFKKAAVVKPPAHVWNKIKARIETKQTESPCARFLEGLHALLRAPKPVFAVATVMAAILIVIVLVKIPSNGQKAMDAYFEDQIDFMSYLSQDYEEDYSGLGYIDWENENSI